MKTLRKWARCARCPALATGLAYSREKEEVVPTCDICARAVADEQSPEYIEHCPNCGCTFGVN